MSERAVIFDMDGVLADTYQPHFESWKRLYGELGLPYSEDDFAKDFGRTSRDILRRTLGADLSEGRIRELDGRKEAAFRDIVRNSSVAMDGAAELIDAVVADGFKLAVGSSGPPENIALLLEIVGRRDKFSAVVSGADVTRGKPDPQVFQLAAERLDVPASRCIVVEDAVHGVEAAHRAGMKCVALSGTLSRDELKQADLVVDSLREITPEKLRELRGE